MSIIYQESACIHITPIPDAGISLEELNDLLSQIKKILKSEHCETIIMDLKGCSEENYSLMTFLIALGRLANNSSIGVEFKNLDKEILKKTLLKIGFLPDGKFNEKNFKHYKHQSVLENIGSAVLNIASDMKKLLGFTGETFSAFLYFIRNPKKISFSEVLFYMDKSGADAVPIVLLICFLMGVILAFQSVSQMGRFGLEIYTADLVALVLVRELGPLMVAMICIGRAGSAYAAELGTMKVAEEIDAMHTMGIKPERFIVVPKILALVCVMPMLVVVGNLAGIIGGVIIGTSMTSVSLIEYINRSLESLTPEDILQSLIKGVVFALIAAGVGCFRGFEADNDAKGVGKATTSSVVSGIFLVVLMDFFITLTYPQFLALLGVRY